MINILIYSEPIVFLEQIEKNSGLLGHFNHNLINPLKYSKNHKYKIYVICNEFQLLDEQIGYDIEIIRLTQKELTNNWKYKPFDLTEQWQTGLYDKNIFKYYCHLFREKITFKPDIIFTVFRVPFLEKLFKNTLILGSSVGIISRSPYPHTSSYVIGDLGRSFDCYTSKYWNSIKNRHQLSFINKKLLEEFKIKIRKILDKNNPYKELLRKYRKDYKYLYLLPLGVPFDMYLAKQGTYRSSLHFLLDVLDNTPDYIGIIVTTHPRYLNYLDEEMICSLKKIYKNFLNDPIFIKYLSASQFLLPEVDGVISMATSVALQAMIFDKKIIALSETFLDFIRDASSFEEFAKILDKPATNKDDLLFWYLTRYCPTAKYYLDSEWLDTFLMRSLEKFKKKDFADFYELIDEPSVIFNYLIENLDDNIPYRTQNINNRDKEIFFKIKYNNPIKYNRDFLFKNNSLDNIYLNEGFSLPENDHIWTNQNIAEIEFPIQLTNTKLRLSIMGSVLTKLQTIEIMVNNHIYGKIENDIFDIVINTNDLKEKKHLNIKLIVSKLFSPKELGMNDDPRKLGFALISIGLYEYN